MKTNRKIDKYIEARSKGMKYREIAEIYGVSYQAVAQACAKYSPGHFVPFTEERLVYPNWRNWMNENKVPLKEFLRRLGLHPSGNSVGMVRNYMRGDHYPPKHTIDKILEITGLTYEQLWDRSGAQVPNTSAGTTTTPNVQVDEGRSCHICANDGFDLPQCKECGPDNCYAWFRLKE